MTEDEIVNEIYDQTECIFSLQCDKCYTTLETKKSGIMDKEAAADYFFEEGFTFKKFKPDEVGGEIVCGKCR